MSSSVASFVPSRSSDVKDSFLLDESDVFLDRSVDPDILLRAVQGQAVQASKRLRVQRLTSIVHHHPLATNENAALAPRQTSRPLDTRKTVADAVSMVEADSDKFLSSLLDHMAELDINALEVDLIQGTGDRGAVTLNFNPPPQLLNTNFTLPSRLLLHVSMVWSRLETQKRLYGLSSTDLDNINGIFFTLSTRLLSQVTTVAQSVTWQQIRDHIALKKRFREFLNLIDEDQTYRLKMNDHISNVRFIVATQYRRYQRWYSELPPPSHLDAFHKSILVLMQ